MQRWLYPRPCRSLIWARFVVHQDLQTKGKVERPFRYIREDFFLGGTVRNLDDLNAQLRHWLEVDPVWWTSEHLCWRSPPWRRRDHPTRRSSGDSWLNWSARAGRRKNWLGSSSRPPSRSGTGLRRRNGTRVPATVD